MDLHGEAIEHKWSCSPPKCSHHRASPLHKINKIQIHL